MPVPMYANRGQRPSSVAKKAARNAMFKAAGTAVATRPSTTSKISQQQLDRVVQSVNDATKRLSQPESAMSGSTTTKSSKRKSRDTVGPWKLGKTLGKGSSGRVRLAKNMETGQLAAIKIVPKKKCKNDPGSRSSSKSSESDASATMNTTTSTNRATTNATTNAGHSNVPANPYGIEREIVIMKLISHSNVLGLYEVWENKSELYLVLEYVDGGELFDYLVSKGKLGEREAVHYFRQVVQGVSYCHAFNICHRDLKPENLLLDKKNKSIKIADFGMAALEVSNKLLQTSCGSPHYASPEIVMGRPYHGGPSDVWSCGIILFALLTGHLPFNDDNIKKLLLKVQSGRYHMPQNLSPEAKDLISKILVVNPFRRIPTNEILNHPLLTKYDKFVKPVKYRTSANMALSQGKSNSDLHVLEEHASKIVKLRSRNEIDDSIVSNLQILWHGASRQLIVSKLLKPTMSEEKLFYSLLLNYKEKHSPKPEPEAPATFEPTVTPPQSVQTVKSIQPIHSAESFDRAQEVQTTLPTEAIQPHQSVIPHEKDDVDMHEEEVEDEHEDEVEDELSTDDANDEEAANNDIQDTSAPKLQQKSQFSTPSIKQESMSGFPSMNSNTLSGVPSLPSNSLPPAMPIFAASSSRTFKNSGSTLSLQSRRSLKKSASKSSLSNSTSRRSLHHSVSKKSLQPSPSTTTLQHSASKKSLRQSPPRKTLQNSASKRSLYSQTSISKRSLNLSEYVANESVVLSEMEQQLKPNLPSSDSNGDFEKLCEQILFGNALDKILEEEEEDTASSHDNSFVSEKTLTKADVSPSPEKSKDDASSSADHPSTFEFSEEHSGIAPRSLASKKATPDVPERSPFRDITNVPTSSGPKTFKLKRDASQKSNLSEVLKPNQAATPTYASLNIMRNGSRQNNTQSRSRHPAELRSTSEGRPKQQGYSLDPRRNATQPANPKVLENLFQKPKTKSSLESVKTNEDWSSTSGFNFDTKSEMNFDNNNLDNLFGKGFNRLEDGLDGEGDSKLTDRSESQSEKTNSSYWQPSLRGSQTDSEMEQNSTNNTGFFETSDVNVLAHSSIIQKSTISRQPSILSSTGTFRNLNEQLQRNDDQIITRDQSNPTDHSNVLRKHSTELTLAPRSTLTAALGPRDRSPYTNSFFSNMSDMSDVMEMPTNTYVAKAVEVSNNSSAEHISDFQMESDRDVDPSSSQEQRTTATFEDNNINIFEDAPVDSESIETTSTTDSQQNVRRKAVSIDTLHTTNVLTPATNVRVSLYMNNNANSESPLQRETTEEIISKFKLSPEKSSQPLVQKRFSAAAANPNSDMHSTMTIFKDLEEGDGEGSSSEQINDEGDERKKPNRVTMLFDNDEELPQLKQTNSAAQKQDNVQREEDQSQEGINPEKTKQSEPKYQEKKDCNEKQEEPEPEHQMDKDEKVSQMHERAMQINKSLKRKRKNAPLVTVTDTTTAGANSNAAPPAPVPATKPPPPPSAKQLAKTLTESTPVSNPPVSNPPVSNPPVSNPPASTGNFAKPTHPRKQNWFSKLFGGLKSQRKSDTGKLQQDHFTKISFDDAHLLTLHEFDKNAVEYHLKGLEHKLHDEKVEYDCKFPNGFAFKIKIASSVFPGRVSTVITVKKKGRATSPESRSAFQAFNLSVAKVLRDAEHNV
ncbi:HSL1 (YKL101W) [Zygosaccharomyces parabailii]|nr:HSL1 (YKL101W) [Zygosaccharomyces parabailii]